VSCKVRVSSAEYLTKLRRGKVEGRGGGIKGHSKVNVIFILWAHFHSKGCADGFYPRYNGKAGKAIRQKKSRGRDGTHICFQRGGVEPARELIVCSSGAIHNKVVWGAAGRGARKSPVLGRKSGGKPWRVGGEDGSRVLHPLLGRREP